MNKNALAKKTVYCILLAILFPMFFLNFFSTATPAWFQQHQKYSQSYVTIKIAESLRPQPKSRYIGLGRLDPKADEETLDKGLASDAPYVPYFSQLGGQGIVLAKIAPAIHAAAGRFYNKLVSARPDIIQKSGLTQAEITTSVLEAIVAFLTAAAVAGLILWIYVELGFYPALCALLGTAFAPWLIATARNLYWVPALWFLPMLATAFTLKRVGTDGGETVLHTSVMTGLVCLAVFMKSATGYEYTSSVMIAASVPVFYYAIRNKFRPSLFLGVFTAFSAACLSGFLAAVLAHVNAIAAYLDVPLNEGFRIFLQHAGERTFNAGNALSTQEMGEYNIPTSTVTVHLRYLLQFWRETQGVFMPPILWFVPLLYLTFRVKTLSEAKTRAWLIAAWISVLAPYSWFILAAHHSAVHLHLNFVIWHLPFTFMVAALLPEAVNLLRKQKTV